MALNQWPIVQRARMGRDNLAVLLGTVPVEQPRTELPKPRAKLDAKGLTVVAPGEKQGGAQIAELQRAARAGDRCDRSIRRREILACSGADGALAGGGGGTIRLDSASLDQYGSETLGRHIGYLPQRVELFDGTIAENIARLSPEPDDQKVVAAARMAAAHEMILELPDGYDTDDSHRSGSSVGRADAADRPRPRALRRSGDRGVLDEPNSSTSTMPGRRRLIVPSGR